MLKNGNVNERKARKSHMLRCIARKDIESNAYNNTLIKVNDIPIGIVNVYTRKGEKERQYVAGSFVNELAAAVRITIENNYSYNVYVNLKEWVKQHGGVVVGKCSAYTWSSSDFYNLVFPSFKGTKVELVKKVNQWEDIGGKRELRHFQPERDSLANSVFTTVNGKDIGYSVIHEPQYQEPYISVKVLNKIAEMFGFPKPDYQQKFIELFPWVLQNDGIVQIVNPYDKNNDHLIITFPGKKILEPEQNPKGFFSRIISKFRSL